MRAPWVGVCCAALALSACRREGEQREIDARRLQAAEAWAEDRAARVAPAVRDVEGVITRVEGESIGLRTADGRDVTLVVGPGTTMRGEPVSAPVLDEGRPVRASYLEQDGTKIARTLEYLDLARPTSIVPAPERPSNPR